MKSHKINTLLAVLLLFLIPHQIIICQSALDSIKGIVFNSELPDSLRAFNADRLAGYYIGRNTDSAVYYNEEAFELVANIKAEKLLIGIKLAQLDIHAIDGVWIPWTIFIKKCLLRLKLRVSMKYY